MEEYLDIVDENGNLTGEKELRSVVHEKGLWHQTVHVYFYRKINSDVEFLVHLRSKNKSSSPNKWDTRFGGHVEAGQDIDDSAKREVVEEVGIELESAKLIKSRTISYDGGDNKEFIQVYYYNFLGDEKELSFSDGEVQAVRWIRGEEIIEQLENDPESWTTNGRSFEGIVADLRSRLQ